MDLEFEGQLADLLPFTCLTFSIHQSHICNAAQVGHLHSNPHIPHCKTQLQMSCCLPLQM